MSNLVETDVLIVGNGPAGDAAGMLANLPVTDVTKGIRRRTSGVMRWQQVAVTVGPMVDIDIQPVTRFTPPAAGSDLHEAYVEAVNAALENGRESLAHELAKEYLTQTAPAKPRSRSPRSMLRLWA